MLGIWYSSYYSGAFVGPTLGGVLINIYGFGSLTLSVAIMFGGLFIVNVLELLNRRCLNYKKHEHYQKLSIHDIIPS